MTGIGAETFGLGGTCADAASVFCQALLATRFSRTDESEADHSGLQRAARTGKEPRAGITLWRKMTSGNLSDGLPELPSSRPEDPSRIAQIQKLLSTVIALHDVAK